MTGAAHARPIGAHAPVAGGLATVGLKYAAAVGAETMQIFVTNPRAWAAAPGNDEQSRLLREHVEQSGFPVFIHAPYLINVASMSPVVRARSATLLGHCLRRAAAVGARGVVVHAGSAITDDHETGLGRVRQTVLPLLDTLPQDSRHYPGLLIEPMAGQGNMLCARIGDIAPYLAALDWHPRALLCVDTCHLFAAGHDLTAADGVAAALAQLAEVAPGRLRLIHANDARDGCGSRKDRHANIGRGTLGTRPFWDLLHHPSTAGIPFIVETPGGEKGHGTDIMALKRLRQSTRRPADRREATERADQPGDAAGRELPDP